MFINNFDPVALEIFSLEIRWYSLAYIFGIILGWIIAKKLLIQDLEVKNKFDDYLTYLIIGIILGGRLGYIFIYNFSFYINNPLDIFKIWQGGMSFHGGLIGVIISLVIFCYRKNIELLKLLDGVALAMPIGLGLVRVGNFLNGELYGKATNGDWGFIFPTDPFGVLRHPSQIYESFGEGLLLFLILFVISKQTNIKGIVSSSFLIFYGLIRFIIEFFRQPDAHIGYVAFDSLSMGQILCIPMMIIGFFMLLYSRRKI